MTITTALIPAFLDAIQNQINLHAEEVTELDKAIGDGDHVSNLQRGLDKLVEQADELSQLNWSEALMKIGMTLMSTMGGASGSLFGSMFVTMSKTAKQYEMDSSGFYQIYQSGVEAVMARGKADMGEKTMLDTLIPVMHSIQKDIEIDANLVTIIKNLKQAAIEGMASTKEMLATKGRASFLGERARGHIDAGARTSQLMICAIADVVAEKV